MSYSVYRITAWNGKRELIGVAETAREAADICEADRRENDAVCGSDKMISYDIVGKEKPSVPTDEKRGA